MNLELLPRGAFVVSLDTEAGADAIHVKGRFSMQALDRFCVNKGIDSYLELMQKITVGMSLREYGELIHAAIEDYYREDYKQCPWSVNRVMDEILEAYTPGTQEFISLVKHAIGRLVPIQENPNQPADADQEKKS